MRILITAAMAVALVGPVTWSSAAAQGKTQKISKKLVDKAKDTVKEIEKVSKQLDKTMDQQRKLLSKKKVKDRHLKVKKENSKKRKIRRLKIFCLECVTLRTTIKSRWLRR